MSEAGKVMARTKKVGHMNGVANDSLRRPMLLFCAENMDEQKGALVLQPLAHLFALQD